ncbi:cysteine-rich receptor-like protein kinase 15 [Hibiscus syriacus]|uniref:cysteine-rich receptor-like protein kinase 15 n=1 Tax=Hibiscus syriacus TaxID=106335 RepID=UPI001923636C|nr:cysteine-rich receptor-like protein kinase 15 [Hibiscus syriacus]
MAPEYALEGIFSVKSDVFSFGVVMLKIISGKKNLRFYHVENTPSLIAYAWRLWQEGKGLDLTDDELRRKRGVKVLAMSGCYACRKIPANAPTCPTMLSCSVAKL